MGSLLAAFVGFLLASPWTAVPLGTFLIATGYGWARHQALVARAVTFAMTTVTLVTLGLIVVFIFAESIPAFQYETASVFGVSVPGLGMFTQARWDAVSEPVRYSLLPMIHGTVMVTTIATLVAAPLGVAAALFIAEIAPAAGSRARQAGDRGVGGHPLDRLRFHRLHRDQPVGGRRVRTQWRVDVSVRWHRCRANGVADRRLRR